MISIDYLSSPEYKNELSHFVEEKSTLSKEDLEEKGNKLLESVLRAGIIKIDGEANSVFYQEIRENLKKISHVKPGRKLLKRLLKSLDSHRPIHITYVEGDNGSLTADNGLRIDLNRESFYLNQDKKIFKLRFEILLAHELIHGLHHLENRDVTVKSMAKIIEEFSTEQKILLDEKFDSIEEQITICGIGKDAQCDYLCENAFHLIFEEEFRTSHIGLNLPLKSSPNFVDLFLVGAVGEIKEWVNKKPSILLSTYKIPLKYYNDIETVLSFDERKKMAYFVDQPICVLSLLEILGDKWPNKTELQDFFIKRGALGTDKLGGPFVVSAIRNHWEGANQLLQRADFQLDTTTTLNKLFQIISWFNLDKQKLAELIAKVYVKHNQSNTSVYPLLSKIQSISDNKAREKIYQILKEYL